MRYKLHLSEESLNVWPRYKNQIFYLLLFCIIGSIALYKFVDRQYVSSASILPGGASQASQVANLASQFGYDVGNQTTQLTDPIVLKKIATNLDISSRTLRQKISIDGVSKEIFYFLFPDYDIDDELDFENGIKKLGNNHLFISKDLEGPIINFKVITNHPKLSYEICNIIFQNTIQSVNSLDQSTKKGKLEFLSNRINSVKEELTQKENVIEKFLIENRNIDSPSLETKYNRLISEANVIKQLYITLRTGQEFNRVDLNADNNNNIYLIKEPHIPIGRSFPKLINLILFFSLFILFFISIYLLKNIKIKKVVN